MNAFRCRPALYTYQAPRIAPDVVAWVWSAALWHTYGLPPGATIEELASSVPLLDISLVGSVLVCGRLAVTARGDLYQHVLLRVGAGGQLDCCLPAPLCALALATGMRLQLSGCLDQRYPQPLFIARTCVSEAVFV